MSQRRTRNCSRGTAVLDYMETFVYKPSIQISSLTIPVQRLQVLMEKNPTNDFYKSLWKYRDSLSEKQITCINSNYEKLSGRENHRGQSR